MAAQFHCPDVDLMQASVSQSSKLLFSSAPSTMVWAHAHQTSLSTSTSCLRRYSKDSGLQGTAPDVRSVELCLPIPSYRRAGMHEAVYRLSRECTATAKSNQTSLSGYGSNCDCLVGICHTGSRPSVQSSSPLGPFTFQL